MGLADGDFNLPTHSIRKFKKLVLRLRSGGWGTGAFLVGVREFFCFGAGDFAAIR
jgi:hypothetical protein